MDDPPSNAPSRVISLVTVRRILAAPTRLLSYMLVRSGGRIILRHPGTIHASLPNPERSVEARVRRENIYQKEADAYRREGLPVPEQVLQDLRNWEITHGALGPLTPDTNHEP